MVTRKMAGRMQQIPTHPIQEICLKAARSRGRGVSHEREGREKEEKVHELLADPRTPTMTAAVTVKATVHVACPLEEKSEKEGGGEES